MADSVFIIALAAYLVVATTLLVRNPAGGWGFPMFVLLYPVFLVALFFVSFRVVAFTWLGLALANMAVQYIYMRHAGVRKGLASVLIASLVAWPVQFAAAINSARTEKEEHENREANRKKIGALPASVTGTVSYAHHHGTEEGHDSVWLEEFRDLSFMTDSKTYDRIGIAEGKVFTFNVDERDAPDGLAAGKILWITDGSSVIA